MLLRMHEADRARFGGPEWLDSAAAVEALNDLDYDALNALDEQVYAETGVGLIRCVGGQFGSFKLSATRVRLWLGLWHAGVVLKLAEFKPAHLLKLDVQIPGAADAVPPASSPGSSDTSTSATTPESETSGSASTPGRPAPTGSSQPTPAS